ncbi:hypothetical protein GOODEAATRI_021628, partial [Goodea atripinnis]
NQEKRSSGTSTLPQNLLLQLGGCRVMADSINAVTDWMETLDFMERRLMLTANPDQPKPVDKWHHSEKIISTDRHECYDLLAADWWTFRRTMMRTWQQKDELML